MNDFVTIILLELVSVSLKHCSYNSLWYETPTKSQRMLLFVMQASLRPIFLSAGKIYIFSMENFTMVKIIIHIVMSKNNNLFNDMDFKIVQTSMSYFTILSSLD